MLTIAYAKRSETLSTIMKVGLGAGLIALLVWGSKAAKLALSNFKLAIVAYGRPTLSSMVLTVPLQIRFSNPTPLPITVDRLIADIFINKNGQFIPAAKINQAITIAPGVSTQWLMPAINLQSIFGGNFLNTTLAVQQILSSKKLTLRADVTAVYKGLELPEQSFTQDVAI